MCPSPSREQLRGSVAEQPRGSIAARWPGCQLGPGTGCKRRITATPANIGLINQKPANIALVALYYESVSTEIVGIITCT